MLCIYIVDYVMSLWVCCVAQMCIIFYRLVCCAFIFSFGFLWCVWVVWTHSVSVFNPRSTKGFSSTGENRSLHSDLWNTSTQFECTAVQTKCLKPLQFYVIICIYLCVLYSRLRMWAHRHMCLTRRRTCMQLINIYIEL